MRLKFLLALFLLGTFSIGFVGCDDDDDPDPQTITDIAINDNQLSTLVDALVRVNFDDLLDGTGPFTVFAPTNAAFNAAGINLNSLSDGELQEILLYHVLGGEVRSTDLAEGQTYASTAADTGPNGEQLSILIERIGSNVTVNGAADVIDADIFASNGVIHVVDAVLVPFTIVDHAAANDDFDELVNALVAAPGNLVSTLDGPGPFTVFAPVNNAFDQISGIVSSLTPSQLQKVLTYHVINGDNVRSTDLSDGISVLTLAGDSFEVNISGNNVSLIDTEGNAANVIFTDVQATNGVIHVLDRVIIPTL